MCPTTLRIVFQPCYGVSDSCVNKTQMLEGLYSLNFDEYNEHGYDAGQSRFINATH